ncbi:MAG: nucleotide exchange factor GrpE [Candidatus Eisenbacteria bacterium]|nr:nucleotide exchange factor GrpE [Candidatus Eisenbacteria bacterium]
MKRKRPESGREIPVSFPSREKPDTHTRGEERPAAGARSKHMQGASDADKARLLDEQEVGPSVEVEVPADAEPLESTGVTEAEIEEVRPEARERGLAEEYLEHLQRLQAEFANYRKRAIKEMRESCDSGKAELVCKLLPVLDDFERALESLTQDAGNQETTKGVGLIYEKLRSVLQAEGLEHVECAGQQFDPNVHEAVVVTRVKEGEDGRVLRDFQKGYSFKGKLIRPSKVEVAQVEEDNAGRE